MPNISNNHLFSVYARKIGQLVLIINTLTKHQKHFCGATRYLTGIEHVKFRGGIFRIENPVFGKSQCLAKFFL
jgi:hypothetical protein